MKTFIVQGRFESTRTQVSKELCEIICGISVFYNKLCLWIYDKLDAETLKKCIFRKNMTFWLFNFTCYAVSIQQLPSLGPFNGGQIKCIHCWYLALLSGEEVHIMQLEQKDFSQMRKNRQQQKPVANVNPHPLSTSPSGFVDWTDNHCSVPSAHSTSSYRGITIISSDQTRKLRFRASTNTQYKRHWCHLTQTERARQGSTTSSGKKVFIAVENSHTPRQGEKPAHIES